MLCYTLGNKLMPNPPPDTTAAAITFKYRGCQYPAAAVLWWYYFVSYGCCLVTPQTRLLLPHKFPGDIDYGISYLLFHLPGMAPVSRDGMDKFFMQSSFAL